jgi:hypothetical protein
MKLTKSQLKELIKEELSTLEEGEHHLTVGWFQKQLRDGEASHDGKVRVQLDGRGPDLDIFEWMVTDNGDILLSVEAPRR